MPDRRVIVTNTPLPVSGTVFVRDVDNPARQPFQIGFRITMMNSGTEQVFQSITVPDGKRLVIEYVSMASGSVPVGQKSECASGEAIGGDRGTKSTFRACRTVRGYPLLGCRTTSSTSFRNSSISTRMLPRVSHHRSGSKAEYRAG
jgi:hypothetical protein